MPFQFPFKELAERIAHPACDLFPNIPQYYIALGQFPTIIVFMHTIDNYDHKILGILQRNASASLEEIGASVALSRNACWRRIKALEEAGIIRKRVALLDPDKLGISLQVFIQIRTSQHSAKWLEDFSKAVKSIPEIQGAHRMSGDLDYLIRARVPDMAGYDHLYRRLIAKVELSDVSASFVMESIKDTTELPL